MASNTSDEAFEELAKKHAEASASSEGSPIHIVENTTSEETPNISEMVKDNPQVRDAAIQALARINQINGRPEIDGSINEETITNITTEISNSLSTNQFSSSNIEAAKAALEKEGEDAVRAFKEYSENPNEFTAKALTDGGKALAELQTRAQLAGFMVTQAQTMQTTSASYEEQKISTSSITSGVLTDLNSMRNGNKNRRNAG